MVIWMMSFVKEKIMMIEIESYLFYLGIDYMNFVNKMMMVEVELYLFLKKKNLI